MPKNIALCFDGTWNTPKNTDGGQPALTNVAQLYAALPENTAGQIRFYHPGVGTEPDWIEKVLGGINGAGLMDIVVDGYKHLIGNFEPGDNLYLFGFSRGAFTARSLGGLIRKCGVLKAPGQEAQALALYHVREDGADSPEAVAFRARYSHETDIHFIGVWDTVGALGIPVGIFQNLNHALYEFHDTELSGSVKNAYHALAVDEHRKAFEPTLWLEKPKPGQVVEQRWFCGAHANVGGGYADERLSDLALAWIRDKAAAAGLQVGPLAAPVDAYEGVLRDSYAEFFQWWLERELEPRVLRELTLGVGSQTLDPTVIARLTWPTGGYAPANVLQHGAVTQLAQYLGGR